MDALSTIPPALRAVRRNPVLFVVPALLALLQLPQLVVQAVSPFVGGLVSLLLSGVMILALPFLQAGLVAMAAEALDGETRLGTLVAAGKEHYVSVFVAFLVLLGCNVVVFGLVFVGVFVGTIVLFAGAGPSPLAFTVLGLVALVVFGLYLLVVFFLQFYAQAIVVDDLGAFDGLKRSVSVVRANLANTFVYSLIGGGVGVLFGLFGAVFSLATTPMPAGPSAPPTSALPAPLAPLAGFEPSLTTVAVGFLALVVVATVAGAIMTTYSVAFYRAVRPAVG
jgi:hypothetical protein